MALFRLKVERANPNIDDTTARISIKAAQRESTMNVNFEKGAGKHVVECFGKTLDDEGFIIDQDSRKRVQYRGDDVHVEDLAMVEDGSTIFVDDSFSSLVEHVERNRE